MAILKGDQAREWIKKNPGGGYKVTGGSDPEFQGRNTGNLLYNIGRGIVNPIFKSTQVAGMLADRTGNTSKYLSDEDLEQYNKGKLNYTLQKGAGGLAAFLPGGGTLKGAAAAGGLIGFSDADLSKGVGEGIKNTAFGAGTGLATAGILKGIGGGVNKLANKGKVATAADFQKIISSQGKNAKMLGNTGEIGDINSVLNALSNSSFDDQITKQGLKLDNNVRRQIVDELEKQALNSGDLNPQFMKSLERFKKNLPTEGVTSQVGQKPGKVNQFFKDMRNSEIAVPTGKNDFNPLSTTRELGENLGKRKLPRTTEGILKGKEAAGQQLDAYIDDVFRKNPNKTYSVDEIFDQNFNDDLQSLAIGMQTDKSKLMPFVQSFAGQGKYGGGKGIEGAVNRQYSIGDVKQMLQDINGALRDKNITGARKQVAQQVKNRLMGIMTADAPEYSKIAKEYAMYAAAENPTAVKQLRGTQTASINPITEFGSKVYNKGKRVVGATGDTLTGGGIPGGASAQKLAQKLQGLQGYLEKSGLPKTQIAAILGANAMLDYEDNNGNGIPDSEEGLETEGTEAMASEGMELERSEADPVQDIARRRQEIAMSMLQMKDAKGNPMYDYATALKQADAALQIGGYDTSVLEPKKAAKEPSAADKKLTNQANTGTKAIDRLIAKTSKDGGLPLKSKLPGILQPASVKQYENDVNLAAEMFGRVQSGGAINKEEEERFRKLIKDAFADKGTSIEKLEQLKEYFSGIE